MILIISWCGTLVLINLTLRMKQVKAIYNDVEVYGMKKNHFNLITTKIKPNQIIKI